MAPSPFAMMRLHPKKSIFFLTTANTALWFTYDYTISSDLRRRACKKAASLGDEKLRHFNAQPRHLTVILNPVAGKRKSKKLYTRWVEPLLHLAGIKVSLIETELPHQAYELMKIMTNCDGVAIVGGDGTVHEALNGLLHRPDSVKAAHDFPIAIMPTGQQNSIARLIHQGLHYRNQKELLIQATLKVIDSTKNKCDVLKILPLDQEERSKEPPIFALRDIKYGKYQDHFVKISSYPFFQDYIKPYWLRLQRTLNSKFTMPQIESISYTNPCIGCSRCIEKHKPRSSQMSQPKPSTNRRWWSMLAPVSKSEPSAKEKMERELSQRDNPECGKWKYVQGTSDISDFRACMVGEKTIRVSISRGGEFKPSEVVEAQDVKLNLAPSLDKQKKPDSQRKLVDDQIGSESSELDKEKEKKLKDEATVKFLIDGQPVQAHSIEVSTLSKAVTIFTGE